MENRDIIKKLNKIYSLYNYLDLSEGEKEQIFNLLIKKLDEEDYTQEKLYSDFSRYLENFTKKNLKIKPIETISNFLRNLNTLDEETKFKKLIKFLDDHDYEGTVEDMIDLFGSEELYNLLSFIVSKNLVLIKDKKYRLMKTSSLAKNFISALCITKNIVITDDDVVENEEDDDDYVYDDNEDDKTVNWNNVIGMFVTEKSKKIMSPEEERDVFNRYKNGETELRDYIQEKNILLVISIAKRYIASGVPFEELINEGQIGLLKAIDKYDPSKGNKFSTYATWWIMQAITRYIGNTKRRIRLPIYLYSKIVKFQNAYSELSSKYGRKPTAEELSEHLNMSLKEVNDLLKIRKDATSLDKQIGDENDSSTLGDFVVSGDKTPEDAVVDIILPEDLRKLISIVPLSDRERQILSLRFGLDDGVRRSLEEVGKIFGVTRERIRQLQEKALKKIKHPKYLYYLAQLSDDSEEIIRKNNISKPTSNNVLKQVQDIKTNKTQVYNNQPIKQEVNKKSDEVKAKPIKVIPKKDAEKTPVSTQREGKNLFELFSEYSKDEILIVIKTLSEDEKNVLIKRYGNDFDKKQNNNNWTRIDNYNLYNVIFPKIRRRLQNNRKYNNLVLDEVIENKVIENEINKGDEDMAENKRKKIKPATILFNCTQEILDSVLNELTEDERNLFKKRYSETEEWTSQDTNKFYGFLYPKIKKKIAAKMGITNEPKQKIKENKIVEEKIDVVDEVIIDEVKEEVIDVQEKEEVVIDQVKEEIINTEVSEEPKSNENLDMISYINMMKSITFLDLIKNLSHKEAVVIILGIIGIDGKVYSSEEISKFLGIDIEEIKEINTKILLLYKNEFNDCLEKLIGINNPSKTLKKEDK